MKLRSKFYALMLGLSIPFVVIAGLETGTYINSLVATNPLSSDPAHQGDDHLRLIKSTIKSTFANINAAVTASDEELNFTVGSISGTYSPTVTGCSGSPSLTLQYVRFGPNVILTVDGGSDFTCTSNSTQFSFSIPSSPALRPSTENIQCSTFTSGSDNTLGATMGCSVSTSGTLTLYKCTGSPLTCDQPTSWTASGSKGFLNYASFTYTIM